MQSREQNILKSTKKKKKKKKREREREKAKPHEHLTPKSPFFFLVCVCFNQVTVFKFSR